MATATNKMSKSTMVKILVNLLIPLAIYLIPTNEVFTHELKLYFVITMLAILAFAFEVVSTTVTAILLPILYTLFHLAPVEVVYSSYANSMLWMVLGGLMLADMANKAGLLRRIAYKCIILTGGTYRGIIFGLGLAGLIATILLAGNGVIPMAALAFGICVALDIKNNKAAAGIMLASAFGCILSGSFMFNPAPLMYAGFANMTDYMNLSWIQYFTKQAVGVILFVVTLIVVEKMCRPKEAMNGKAYFEEEYAKLGKVSAIEWKAAIICILLLVAVITADIHKIPLMWCFALVPLLAYVPGIAICDESDIRKTNFGMVFFIASCLSIGTVGTALGIGPIVSQLAMPILQGQSVSVVFFIIYIIFVLLNFVMTPAAIAAAFSLPFASICLELGINPAAFFLFETIALDQIFLPYEYVMYLVVFSFGVMTTKDFFQVMTVKFILATIYIFLLLIPFWQLIGFLYI